MFSGTLNSLKSFLKRALPIKFLKTGKDLGNQTENGKKMFIYQAAEAFKLWHNIQPEINKELIELLD